MICLKFTESMYIWVAVMRDDLVQSRIGAHLNTARHRCALFLLPRDARCACHKLGHKSRQCLVHESYPAIHKRPPHSSQKADLQLMAL